MHKTAGQVLSGCNLRRWTPEPGRPRSRSRSFGRARRISAGRVGTPGPPQPASPRHRRARRSKRSGEVAGWRRGYPGTPSAPSPAAEDLPSGVCTASAAQGGSSPPRTRGAGGCMPPPCSPVVPRRGGCRPVPACLAPAEPPLPPGAAAAPGHAETSTAAVAERSSAPGLPLPPPPSLSPSLLLPFSCPVGIGLVPVPVPSLSQTPLSLSLPCVRLSPPPALSLFLSLCFSALVLSSPALYLPPQSCSPPVLSCPDSVRVRWLPLLVSRPLSVSLLLPWPGPSARSCPFSNNRASCGSLRLPATGA